MFGTSRKQHVNNSSCSTANLRYFAISYFTGFQKWREDIRKQFKRTVKTFIVTKSKPLFSKILYGLIMMIQHNLPFKIEELDKSYSKSVPPKAHYITFLLYS